MPLTEYLATRQASVHPRLAAAVLCSLSLFAGAICAPAAHATSVGEFESLAPSPQNLTSIAADTTTNIVYGQQNAGNLFYRYDPRTNEWTELAEAPINSGNNGGAAYLNGKIYTAYTQESEHLGVYDIASNTWTTIANPLGQGTADITAVGEELYLAVGNRFVKYNPATETMTELASSPVEFEPWGGLEPYEGKIYGDTGNGSTGFAVYNIGTNEWTELPTLPGGAVAGSGLDPVSGTYFADGSYGGTSFYSYAIGSNTWSTSTLPFEIGDSGMAYVSLPGHVGVYVSQGENGTAFDRYVTPEPEAELALTNSASTATTVIGGEISYTMTVANAGPQTAGNVTLSDPLPSNVSLVSTQASQGSCSGAVTLTCNLGTLAKGAMATVTITVRVTGPGAITNTASVSSDAHDPSSANNTASATTAVASGVSAPAAAISAPANGRTFTQGQTVATTFSCSEGAGGPGLASCNDSNGTTSASGGSGHLDTSRLGAHTYSVTASSRDGRATTASISYTVRAKGVITIKLVRKAVKHGNAKVVLACSGARCIGRLSLAWVRKVHQRVRTTLVSRLLYTLEAGKSKQFVLSLTHDGLKVLRRAAGLQLEVRTRATTHEGEVVRRFVPLKLA
jgi:uncharacterized repeat protein (TIGR01451 family)